MGGHFLGGVSFATLPWNSLNCALKSKRSPSERGREVPWIREVISMAKMFSQHCDQYAENVLLIQQGEQSGYAFLGSKACSLLMLDWICDVNVFIKSILMRFRFKGTDLRRRSANWVCLLRGNPTTHPAALLTKFWYASGATRRKVDCLRSTTKVNDQSFPKN